MDATRPAYCRLVAFRAFAAELSSIDEPGGLFRAAWAIAQHERPSDAVASGEETIAKLVEAVQRHVRSNSPEARLAHLHDVMFDVLGFRGETDNYYDAANSYLPDVLRRRRGLPISLTLVYRSVAAGVGLTVHGVNAPGHFLAEVELEQGEQRQSMYVDPFFGGGILSPAEIYQRIAQTTGKEINPSPVHLARATPRQWLARMLHNLQAVFAAAGRDRDVFAMQELHGLLTPDY